MTEKPRYNTRYKRVPGALRTTPCYVGQYRPVGAKRWKTLETKWHMPRDANVHAVQQVGLLGGVCTHEGMPD